MANVHDSITQEITENPVVLFMKGTPEFPQCGFSGQVVQILDYLGAPFKGVNVLADADIRQGIKEFSNWPTIPQLYVKGEFVAVATLSAKCSSRGNSPRISPNPASSSSRPPRRKAKAIPSPENREKVASR